MNLPLQQVPVFVVGVGVNQALKAKINEPLSDPSKRVMFFTCFAQYDA